MDISRLDAKIGDRDALSLLVRGLAASTLIAMTGSPAVPAGASAGRA